MSMNALARTVSIAIAMLGCRTPSKSPALTFPPEVGPPLGLHEVGSIADLEAKHGLRRVDGALTRRIPGGELRVLAGASTVGDIVLSLGECESVEGALVKAWGEPRRTVNVPRGPSLLWIGSSTR